eukprot:56833-Rhodomonas_salina.3
MPLCQYLYAWRVHLDPAIPDHKKGVLRKEYMMRAAEQGFPEAMFKTARNVMGDKDYTSALNWFTKACSAGDADACFQYGQIQLMLASARSKGEDAGTSRPDWAEQESAKAIVFFEAAAVAGSSPSRGAAYAMYNLGVAHLFGMGGLRRDPDRAAEVRPRCRTLRVLVPGLTAAQFARRKLTVCGAGAVVRELGAPGGDDGDGAPPQRARPG